MSRLLDRYQVCRDKIESGVWVKVDDWEFQLGYMDQDLNPRYGAFVEEYRANVLDDPITGKLDGKQSLDCVRKGFKKAILYNWKNPDNIDFSEENVDWLFEECPTLYYDLQDAARDFTRFKKDKQNEQLGNSKDMSAGQRNTPTKPRSVKR